MPRKPNYGFEKRQRELSKKAKKEEKRLRRQEEAAAEPGAESAEDTPAEES